MEIEKQDSNIKKLRDFVESLTITDLQKLELSWLISDLLDEASSNQLKTDV